MIRPVIVALSVTLALSLVAGGDFARAGVVLLRAAMFRVGLGDRSTTANDRAPTSTTRGRTAAAFWFNRCVTNYGEVDDAFIDYCADVKPQVIMFGFFGPEWYAAKAYAIDQKVPALWTSVGGGPVDDEWYRSFIARLHQRTGAKVVGMFALTGIYGAHKPSPPAPLPGGEGRKRSGSPLPRAGEGLGVGGWFDYFDNKWETQTLGAKPTLNGKPIRALDLMQCGADGAPWFESVYKVEGGNEYRGCPSNPAWRATLKRMVKRGIALGLDGFHVVFPQREDCVCEHCQRRFAEFLKKNYTEQQLRDELKIGDPQSSILNPQFRSIPTWYEPAAASPYRHACLRFGQMMLWECMHEVFVDYGRSLKRGLLVGQWNHIYRSAYSGPGQLAGTFAQLNADERCTLPDELWAKDENWVWYSIGNWSMYWKPEQGEFAQFPLEHKYLKTAGHGLPQAVKVDDSTRIRLYLAEAVAHGGFAYARGPNYRDAETQRIVKQYFGFLQQHEDLYRDAENYAEVALVFPRKSVLGGSTELVKQFKEAGQKLVRARALFDVVVDAPATKDILTKHRTANSRLDAPPSVLWTVWQQPQRRRLVAHFLNYKRDTSPPPKGLTGAALERPVAERRIGAQLTLPKGAKVKSLSLISPEAPEPRSLKFTQRADLLTFEVPELFVYAVAIIELKD